MYEKLQLDLGRNSLKYLIQRFNIKEIWIPYYLCNVIRHSVVECGAKPLFYHIDDNFYPTKDFGKEDFILYPNYFGICDKNVQKLASYYSKLIVDNVHAFYAPPQGFACFNSERKFHPGKINSYLWIKKEGTPMGEEDPIEYPGEKARMKYFKEIHKQNEEINLLNLEIETINSPFCYPCLLSSESEADKLVKKLTNEGKTIYRYWNNLPQNYNEYKFYSRLVPIPLN